MFQGPVTNQVPMMNWYNNQQQNTMQNYQPYQQPVYQRPMLSGKMINRTEDITPSDVPMDGSMSLFPMVDGSCILAKTWNTDGTIRTIRYEAATEPVQQEEKKDLSNDILARLEAIEKLLSNRRPNNDQKRGDNNEH